MFRISRPAKRSLVRLRVAATALLVVLGIASSAPAQTSDEKAAADALFDAARQLMDAGEFERACPKFKDSHDLDPAVGTLLNLALCYKSAGMTASAWSTYREAAALARQLDQGEREDLARKEIDELDATLTRLVIEVDSAAAKIPDLVVSRNGKALRNTMWGVPLPVDPGKVIVEASAPGYITRRAEVVADGEGKTITFKVPALTEKGPQAVGPAPGNDAPTDETGESPAGALAVEPLDRDQPQASTNGRSVLPYVLGGVGIAAAGAGTYFAFSSKSSNDKAVALCANDVCASRTEFDKHTSLVSDARSQATIAYIGWGVGGAAIAGAIVWFILDTPQGESAFSLTPHVAEDSWGINARGSF